MRSSRLLHAVAILWIVYIVILARDWFIKEFFYVGMEYYRGPLYPFALLPLVAIQLINLAGTIHRRKLLGRKAFISFLIALAPLTIAFILQLFFDANLFIDICYVLSGLSMYRFVLADQIELDLFRQREIARQQREIAQQRTSILVLQMRPHFIYNTLTSIYCLCRQDPEKTQQITEDFTNYLRRNFDAVVNDKAIPFSSELEHTRAYLAVEQAMYEDMLVVDWDTPFTNFRLPSLTLQPIVENAVKHGRNPNADPLYVFVRTRHTDSGAEIIVEDSGPGFDPDEKGDSGITLKNIRQRLEMMCNGSLTITPAEKGGTVVTITIPDSATQ
jgi:LytS/YehU family sensor histidine kinase